MFCVLPVNAVRHGMTIITNGKDSESGIFSHKFRDSGADELSTREGGASFSVLGPFFCVWPMSGVS